jgi:predicted RNA-binding protein YlxR (DUF448 family)
MAAALKQACKTKTPPGTEVPDGLRRCLATGEMTPRERMIRFVIGPEDQIVPDLSENLPGHGLWVTATVDAVQTAAKKNLFAKAAKHPAHSSPTLAEDVAKLLRKRCLGYLGLAKGAGIAVLGETQTETALRANKLALYLRSPDASRALDNHNSIAECALFTREELGSALGYDQIAYAGLAPHGMTKKIMLEIKRLQSMTEAADRNEG